jgi:hypothetical protein
VRTETLETGHGSMKFAYREAPEPYPPVRVTHTLTYETPCGGSRDLQEPAVPFASFPPGRPTCNKSAVARVWGRKFLGYSFWVAKGGAVKRRVSPKALEEMKQRVRQITGRNGGRSMEQVGRVLGAYLRGWKAYFRLADTPGIFADLDGWIHRRLICIQLKQWKRGRTAYRELTARGLPEWLVRKGAGHGRRWWWAANLGAMHTALPGS